MGGSEKTLVLTRKLSLIILLGLIGIAASPFTQMYTPMYPVYHISEYDEYFVLDDEFPMFEFLLWYADKIVIEELSTNGSPVIINLYRTYDSENPSATIQNVTEIRDVFLAGTSSEDSMVPVFRITRYSNQSAQVSVRLKSSGTYPSTDYLASGPSIFLLLAIPLAYLMYKNWGSRADARGIAIILVILISAILMSGLLVYTYNHGGVLLRHDEVQDVHTYQFKLNESNPLIDFSQSIDLEDSDTFVRICNFSTNDVLVAVTISPEGIIEGVELQTITNSSSTPLQFELPRENLTGYTVQLNRITQDAVINLSIETVRDFWTPWKDPLPYYQFFVVGLALMVIVLIFPQKIVAQTP